MNLYKLTKTFKKCSIKWISIHWNIKFDKKMNSSLSNIKVCYLLKFQIPILNRQFFRIISQNTDFVEKFCNDSNNLFHFAIPKGILEKSLSN